MQSDADKMFVVSDGTVTFEGHEIPPGVYRLRQTGMVALSCQRVLVRYTLEGLESYAVVTTENLDALLGCGEF